MGEQNAFFFLFISSGLSNNTIQFLPQVYVSGVSVGLVRDWLMVICLKNASFLEIHIHYDADTQIY